MHQYYSQFVDVIMKHKIIVLIIGTIIVITLIALAQLVAIRYSGSNVAAPLIPRTIQSLGSAGPKLKYAVMGDSTSVGQGADYKQSYAYASAVHLAKDHGVKLLNVGVSGAVAKDLLGNQLSTVVSFKPDIVLVAVGANDATHFTTSASIKRSLQLIVDELKKNNPNVIIIVTGCPAMGSVDRFPPYGARQLAGLRERQVNTVYEQVISQEQLIFAPVARETGSAFAADPTLFAADRFHPNARGYALWIPVINRALDEALASN